jgi:rsbT co-antagonist protein RsbR
MTPADSLTTTKNPKINVSGLDFEWDLDQGLFLCNGFPTVCMWIDTTMAGFMSGLHKMVGTDRFHLALYQAGEEGVVGEWEHFIVPAPTVEEGLKQIGAAANQVGLGFWELVSLDREKQEARFRAKNSWEALYQKALGVCWGTSSLAGRFAGYCNRIFKTNCLAEQTAFIARGDEWDEFVVRPSDRTVENQLDALIEADKATRADVEAMVERLKLEVQERKQAEARLTEEIHERKQAEQSLVEKLDIIRRQEESIRAMSTPILQLWEGIIALPVIGLVDSARANQMTESLLEEIVKTKARITILDLTGVDVMDTSAANYLLRMVRSAQLLGARCLVSGISPRMAQTVVGLGLDLTELASFNTLEAALRFALRSNEHQLGTT